VLFNQACAMAPSMPNSVMDASNCLRTRSYCAACSSFGNATTNTPSTPRPAGRRTIWRLHAGAAKQRWIIDSSSAWSGPSALAASSFAVAQLSRTGLVAGLEELRASTAANIHVGAYFDRLGSVPTHSFSPNDRDGPAGHPAPLTRATVQEGINTARENQLKIARPQSQRYPNEGADRRPRSVAQSRARISRQDVDIGTLNMRPTITPVFEHVVIGLVPTNWRALKDQRDMGQATSAATLLVSPLAMSPLCT
jgi:hypothetical protein